MLRISFKKTVPEASSSGGTARSSTIQSATTAFPDRKRAGNIKENAEIWEEANRAFKEG